jgi:hypothetical protein
VTLLLREGQRVFAEYDTELPIMHIPQLIKFLIFFHDFPD